MNDKTYQDLLDYWFSERVKEMWFNSTPEFDGELQEEFESIYLEAMRGEHDDWANEVEGALALVILFDQLPLNIYRKEMESFQTEAKSREIARQVIEKKWDESLDSAQKAFLYMPFMHSEDIQDQDLALSLFAKAKLDDNLKFAKHHRDIIVRFGRFPHRNVILGRENTDAEQDYLNSKEAFLG